MGHGRAPPRRCLRKLVLHLDRDCALADAAPKAQYLQLGRADRNKIGARGFLDQNGGITMTIRRAIRRDEFTGIDPIKGLELRRPGGRRDRIASPEEAAALIAALPQGEQALWATAMYGGLRRGELRALRRERRGPRR
jgi:integrase